MIDNKIINNDKSIDTLIEIPCDGCTHDGVRHICNECGVDNKWKMYESIFKNIEKRAQLFRHWVSTYGCLAQW